MNAPSRSVKQWLAGSYQAWTWGSLLVSLLVCAQIASLHYQQERALQQSMKTMSTLHLARIDLAKGFLYIALAKTPQAPFDRENGIALLQQAANMMSREIASSGNLSSQEFEKSLVSFQNSLANFQSNPAEETQLRIAFHDLDNHAAQLDEYNQQYLKDLSENLNQQFSQSLAGSAIFLLALCGVVFFAGRSKARADLETKQAQEAAQISLTKYKALFESFPLAITVSDPNGNILERNARAEALFNLSNDSQDARRIDKPKWVVTDANGKPLPVEMFPAVRALKEKIKIENAEVGVIKSETETIWLNVTAAPLPIDGYGVVITYNNISEQKKAQQKLLENQRIMELFTQYAPASIAMFDRQMRYLVYSQRFITDYRLANIDLIGKSHYEIFPEISENWKEIHRRCLTGAIESAEADPFLRKDGQVDWVRWEIRPWFEANEQIGGIILFSEVITERIAAQEKLHESEELLRLGYETADLGIWRNNIKSGVIHLDERARIHYGMALGDMRIEDLTNRIHPDDRSRVLDEVAAGLTPGGPEKFAMEHRVIHPNHQIHWLAVKVRIVFEGEGEKRHAVMSYGTSMDITERKNADAALRASKKLIQDIINNTPALIYTLDTNGRFLLINRPLEKLLGHPSEELVGRTRNDILPPQIAAAHQANDLDVLQSQSPKFFEEENPQADGMHIYLTTKFPLYDSDGRIYAICGISTDMTAQKQMENELRRSNHELEQFAYIASHDLQEPLRTIAGMVQLLEKRYRGQLDERADEYIHHTIDATQRMQALINDVLAYSRVDRRGNPMKMVDMQDCMQSVLENLGAIIRENQAIITSDPLPDVYGDATQLGQLLQNLIGNALKFRGPRQPTIHISVAEKKDAWQFSLQDNGIGIEPQYYERIFLVFQRLHTRREYPGTGIGLAICKKIVERHGGIIWVESQPGEGSIFSFTLQKRNSNNGSHNESN